MGRTIFILSFAVLVSISSCKDIGETGATQVIGFPSVVSSQTDYQQAQIQARVPDTLRLNELLQICRRSYSDSLKASLIGSMLASVRKLALSVQEFQSCLTATGQQAPGVVALPYLAEHAKYTGKPAWIFEFAWGAYPEDIGHYRCFVMDATTTDTLLFITCR